MLYCYPTDADTVDHACVNIDSQDLSSINAQQKGYCHMLNPRIQATYWQAGALPRIDFGYHTARFSALYPYVKRGLDVLVSAILLILLAPLLVAISIAIKLDSSGPILHVQKRTGQHGRVFCFHKFRSMTNGQDHTQAHRKFAEAYINGQEVVASMDSGGHVVYKPPANGHTVTRVGRWLRHTSLDELPQLVNVLLGDMSLVGPRPTMDYETALYTERHRQRLAVMPGLTGWAQVHGRSGLTFDEIVTLDIDYITRRSFWLDLRVLLATIPVVLRAEHAS